MKTFLSVLAFSLLTLSYSALAETTTYYWGFADTAYPDGKHTKLLVLGRRVEEEKKDKITDTQLYASAEEGISEVQFEFDFKTSKLTSYSNGTRNGGGTFKCDGSLKKHTSCAYSYATEGKGAYRAEGKDVLNIAGAYYREVSDIFYGSDPKAVVYQVDFYTVDKKFYETFRTKLLKN